LDNSSPALIYFGLALLFVAWFIGSYYVAKFAEKAGRSFGTWFLLSVLISPIWMGLYIALRDYAGKKN